MDTITLEMVKMFGIYKGFDNVKKSYVYEVGGKIVFWNKEGLKEK